MGSYVPSTLQERQEMLESIGLSSIDQLFSHIPDELKLKGELNLPSGMSELEVSSAMKKLPLKTLCSAPSSAVPAHTTTISLPL